MSDANNEERRVGRDEMNLCEFPIATLADRVSLGCKTLVFEDRHGKLTVVGSEDRGLPTVTDSDVIVGLIQLTQGRPSCRSVQYRIMRVGWGPNYRIMRVGFTASMRVGWGPDYRIMRVGLPHNEGGLGIASWTLFGLMAFLL